ncbi:hypothetical protein WN944_014719 [Citrus x changshan-huyou]|uniref:Uncharacterized protein n=1 Tax=Citrus x changshan-huyou TaxID=2935761 RepID=A0AAP0M8W2_9ROSI
MFHHNQSLLRKGQQSLLFSDSLKSGGNIERSCQQSCCEYCGPFEFCKVNDLLDAKVDEASDAEHVGG